MKSRFIFAIAINPHHHRSLLQNMHIMTDRSAKTRKPERKPHEIYQHPEPFIGRVLFRASSPPRGRATRERVSSSVREARNKNRERDSKMPPRGAVSCCVRSAAAAPPHHRRRLRCTYHGFSAVLLGWSSRLFVLASVVVLCCHWFFFCDTIYFELRAGCVRLPPFSPPFMVSI